jgi:hypothetical protein
MRTIEGYLEKGRFYPIGRTAEIRGRRRVLVTVLNDSVSQVLDDVNADKKAKRMVWLKRLHEAIDAAQDEELPDEAFTRNKTMRPPLDLFLKGNKR